MPFAARIGDITVPGGAIIGTGIPNVLIGGQPAATASTPDSLAVPSGPQSPAPFIKGSLTVIIGGRPALRVGDSAGNGQTVINGAPNVLIGG